MRIFNSNFAYTKINQSQNDFKSVIELAIIDVDQEIIFVNSDGWQADNHISDHRLLSGRWF